MTSHSQMILNMKYVVIKKTIRHFWKFQRYNCRYEAKAEEMGHKILHQPYYTFLMIWNLLPGELNSQGKHQQVVPFNESFQLSWILLLKQNKWRSGAWGLLSKGNLPRSKADGKHKPRKPLPITRWVAERYIQFPSGDWELGHVWSKSRWVTSKMPDQATHFELILFGSLDAECKVGLRQLCIDRNLCSLF